MAVGVSYTTKPLAVFTRMEDEKPTISKAKSHSAKGALSTSPFRRLYHTCSLLAAAVETVTDVWACMGAIRSTVKSVRSIFS